MKLKIALLAALMAVALQSRAPAAEAQAGKEKQPRTLTIVYPEWGGAAAARGAGKSVSETINIFNQVLRIAEKKLGFELEIVDVGDFDATYKSATAALVKKFKTAGDVAMTNVEGFLMMKEAGIPVYPLFGAEINGKKTMRECVFVRKDGGYESVADLRGKTVSSGYYMNVRPILYENGIDKPVMSFFGKAIKADNFLSGFYMLVLGDIDAYVINEHALKATRLTDSTIFKKVKPLFCSSTEWLMEPFLVAKKGVNDDIVGKLRDMALSGHKDPDFKGFMAMGKPAGLKFRVVAFDLEDIERQKALLDTWRKRGWMEEAEKNQKFFNW